MRHVRRRLFALGLLLVASSCVRGATSNLASAQALAHPALITEISTTVADLDASTRFFSEVLGAKVVDTRDFQGTELDAQVGMPGAHLRVRRLDLGGERLALMQFLEPAGRPPRRDGQSNDLDFQHIALVVRDIEQVHAAVVREEITPVSQGGPQRIPDSNAGAAGIRAFYFRDRDFRPLELIWYPPDKGDSRWHANTGPLVLGVDHSAISVSSTARSQSFYQGLLGLTLRGQGLNEGTEQAALSGIPGARVRISGFGGPSGPGIEFLEYQTPGPGLGVPARTPTTVGYWEVSVYQPDLSATVEASRAAGVQSISSRIAACESCSRGRLAFVVLDPDGHAIRLVGD